MVYFIIQRGNYFSIIKSHFVEQLKTSFKSKNMEQLLSMNKTKRVFSLISTNHNFYQPTVSWARRTTLIENWKCSDIDLYIVLCSLRIAYPFQDKNYIIPKIKKVVISLLFQKGCLTSFSIKSNIRKSQQKNISLKFIVEVNFETILILCINLLRT